MRIKIDYGIDLGTTNSCISRMENGKPIVKKSDTQKDTTPSCVHFNKKKAVLVGDTAFNIMKNDNARALKSFEKGETNTYLEFKRTMGKNQSYPCSNLGKDLTSEELSAEVLKKLKSYIQDENLNSVVITIPAQFQAPQKEATIEAGKLAGFDHVELLQEPVAAATAYGLSANKKDGYWMVFDFGGGTFDAAIVKSEDGILAVKDTGGDNWLGGKDLDNAIVDEIIIPYLTSKYDIDFVMNDDIKLQLLKSAVKPYAEEAKNQLSYKDTHTILTNLGDLPFEDENGEEPEIDIVVTQKDIERVLAPIFQKAIDISKDILKRNNLSGKDLDALILVGGPTLSPILRRMLKEQITENVDTSIDPMTAVATGAALFASTISISDEVRTATMDKTKIQLELAYDSTSVDLEERVSLAINKAKTEGQIPDKVLVEIVRGDGAWSSGKSQISEKKSLIDILLVEGANAFKINAYDDRGNMLEIEPDSFNVLQGIGGLSTMTVLPYNIGIGRYFNVEERDLFDIIPGLEKNNKVPATGIKDKLETRTQLRPGVKEDVIRIPIYQGEYSAIGTNPIFNNWVYDIVITGEDVPKLLPKGSEVSITLKVDRSEKMKAIVDFPLIDYSKEVDVEIKKEKALEASELNSEIKKAKISAKRVSDDKILANLEKLETNLSSNADSDDTRFQILDNLRKEQLALEEKEKTVLWPEIQKELKEIYFSLEDLVDKIRELGDDFNMDKLDSHLKEYKSKVDEIIKHEDIKEAKELINVMSSLRFHLANEATGGAMDVNFLKSLNNNFNTYNWTNPNKARQLINQGLQQVNDGRTNGLRNLIIEVIELMPQDERPVTLGGR